MCYHIENEIAVSEGWIFDLLSIWFIIVLTIPSMSLRIYTGVILLLKARFTNSLSLMNLIHVVVWERIALHAVSFLRIVDIVFLVFSKNVGRSLPSTPSILYLA